MHSQAAGDRAAEDSTTADEAATAGELPALLDGSSDEAEPVSGVQLAASAVTASAVGGPEVWLRSFSDT